MKPADAVVPGGGDVPYPPATRELHHEVELVVALGRDAQGVDGVVVFSGFHPQYGYMVDIDHGNGFVSRLTHLSDVQVELNQRVFIGDPVGVLAEDEDGGKPVMHYELIIDGIPYNPLFYID